MGRTYDPHWHADNLGLTIIEHRLRHGRWGEYLHAERLIVLAPGLDRREHRCTLAHEIQHAIAGDVPSPFGLITKRQELRADRAAALLLVTTEEYAAAELIRDGHHASIAYDLDVTPEILRAWLSTRAPVLAR